MPKQSHGEKSPFDRKPPEGLLAEHGVEEVKKTESDREYVTGDHVVDGIASEIKHAKPGSVVFMRGLSAKASHDEVHDLGAEKPGSAGYAAGVEDWVKKSGREEEVAVVSAEKLMREKGVGSQGQGAEHAIKEMLSEPEYEGKILVVDWQPPHIDSILFDVWNEIGESKIAEARASKGSATESWIANWFAEQAKPHEEGEVKWPKPQELGASYYKAIEAFRGYKSQQLGGRDFTLLLNGDDPLEMLFLTYCAEEFVTPETVAKTMARARTQTDRVVSVTFVGDTEIETSLGTSTLSRTIH